MKKNFLVLTSVLLAGLLVGCGAEGVSSVVESSQDNPSSESSSSEAPVSSSSTEEQPSSSSSAEESSSSEAPVIVTHTVTWVVDTLSVQEIYEEGQVPTYKGTTPVKAQDKANEYEFTGWDKEIVAVTADVTYTAQFASTTRTYNVTFVDGGEILDVKEVAHGAKADAPVMADIDPNGETNLTYFTGWNNGKDEVIYTAENLPLVDGADQIWFANWETLPEVGEKLVNITINLEKEDGTAVADPIEKTYAFGKLFKVELPEVEGLVPNYDYVEDQARCDKEITVTYSAMDKWTTESAASETLEGAGTVASPYVINSVNDWLKFAADAPTAAAETVYSLTKSLDFSDANRACAVTKFASVLEGNGHKLVLNMKRQSSTQVGLFDKLLNGCSVNDLFLTGTVTYDVEAEATTASKYMGAFAQYAAGSITNVTSFINILGSGNVCGLIGLTSSTAGDVLDMDNVVTHGEVRTEYGTSKNSGMGYVGGILGYSKGASFHLTNCDNFGKIAGFNGTAGIVGFCDNGTGASTIEGCVNYGTVDYQLDVANKGGGTRHGGIAGQLCNVTVSKSINFGLINVGDAKSSETFSGGIAGTTSGTATIDGCINFGDVLALDVTKAVKGVGGILGAKATTSATTISNCVNYGNVIAKAGFQVGGILGTTYGTALAANNYVKLTNNTNLGVVVGNYQVGGIAGFIHSGFMVTEEIIMRDNLSLGSVFSMSGDRSGLFAGDISEDVSYAGPTAE